MSKSKFPTNALNQFENFRYQHTEEEKALIGDAIFPEPKNRKEILANNKEFAKKYAARIMKDKENPEEVLEILRPQNEKQFFLIGFKESMEQMLEQAILKSQPKLMELLIESGANFNYHITEKQLDPNLIARKVSLLEIAEEKAKVEQSQEAQKIVDFLKAKGAQRIVNVTYQEVNEKILKQIISDPKFAECGKFYTLLLSKLDAKIQSIKVVVGGEVKQVSSTMDSMISGGLEHIIKEIFEHMPIVGSIVNKAYDYVSEQEALVGLKHSAAFFKNSEHQAQILSDYAIRVVRFSKEEIVGIKPIKLGFREKLISTKNELIGKLVGKNDWSKEWEALAKHFMYSFLKYLSTQKLNYSDDLGEKAAQHYIESIQQKEQEDLIEERQEFQKEPVMVEDQVKKQVPVNEKLEDNVEKNLEEKLEQRVAIEKKVKLICASFKYLSFIQKLKYGEDLGEQSVHEQSKYPKHVPWKEIKDIPILRGGENKYCWEDHIKRFNNPLLDLVFSQDIDKLKAAFESGDKKYTGKYYLEESALLAAVVGNVDLMKIIVKQGCNVKNAKNTNGMIALDMLGENTALDYAAAAGQLGMVRYLVEECGVKVNKKNNDPGPLDFAATSYHPEVMEYLIVHGAISQHDLLAEYHKMLCDIAILALKNGDSAKAEYYNKAADEIGRDIAILALKNGDFAKALEYHNNTVNDNDFISKYVGSNTSFYSMISKLITKAISMTDNLGRDHPVAIKIQHKIFSNDYNNILQLYLLEKYHDALVLADKSQDCLKTKFVKSLILVKQGKCDEVMKYLKDFNSGESQYLQGEILLDQGKPLEALHHYKETLKQDPNFTQALVRKLIIEGNLDALKEIHEYDRALDTQVMIERALLEAEVGRMKIEEQKIVEATQNLDETIDELMPPDILEIKQHIHKQIIASILPQVLTKEDMKVLNRIDYGYKKLGTGKFVDKMKIFSKESTENLARIDKLQNDLKQLDQKIKLYGMQNHLQVAQLEQIFHTSKLITKVQHYYKNLKEKITSLTQGKLSKQIEQSVKDVEVGNKEVLAALDGDQYPRFLTNPLAQELIEGTHNKPNKYGKHTVVPYPKDNPQVFFKYNPYAPGVEYAVTVLYSALGQSIAPTIRLIKVQTKQKDYTYLISNAVIGKNFAELVNHKELIDKIDPDNFSALLIGTLLTSPGDAKADNFVMQIEAENNTIIKTQLISIDNDISFCKGGLGFKTSVKSTEKFSVHSDILNILFLLPQMDQKVSTKIKEQLTRTKIEPERIIAKWLKKLNDQNQVYINDRNFTLDEYERLNLPIKLPLGVAGVMYRKLYMIADQLKNPTTHTELFQQFHPSVAKFYERLRDKTSIMKSIKNLYKAATYDEALKNEIDMPVFMLSSRAFQTISTQKMLSTQDFKKVFDSTIPDAAAQVISMINFARSDNLMEQIVVQYLSFASEFVFHNASEKQIKIFVARNPNKQFKAKDVKCEVAKQIIVQEEEQEVQQEKMSAYEVYERVKQNHDKNQGKLLYEVIDYINTQDEKGNTALHIASQKGDLVTALALLNFGGSNELKNKQDQTASEIAIQNGNQGMQYLITEYLPKYFWHLLELKLPKPNQTAKLASVMDVDLLQKKIEGELVGSEQSPIEIALSNPVFHKLAWLLVQKLPLENQGSLLLLAVKYHDDLQLIQELAKKVGVVSVKDEKGDFATDIAYDLQKYKMVEILIKHGISSKRLSASDDGRMIVKAIKLGLKIEKNEWKDFKTFDYTKTNENGITVFTPHELAKFYEQLRFPLTKEEKFGFKKLNLFSLNENGKTLLDVAAQYDRHDIALELKEAMKKDQERVFDDYDIMYDAAQRGQYKTVKYIMQEFTHSDRFGDVSPRGYAIRANQKDFLEKTIGNFKQGEIKLAKLQEEGKLEQQNLSSVAKNLIKVRDWLLHHEANDWQDQLQEGLKVANESGNYAVVELLAWELQML